MTVRSRVVAALGRRPALLGAARAVQALVAPVRAAPVRAVRDYPRYFASRRAFVAGGGEAPFRDLRPKLGEATATHGVDSHYLHQAAWAMRRLRDLAPASHVDVGGQAHMVAAMSAICDVVFVDIRPLGLDLPGVTDQPGDVCALPFDDGSLQSLSCLHVAEHIGLGRYGDPIDASGTQRAAAELARVVAPGGQLLFSVPVGRRRTEFNAQRVLAVGDVLALFASLDLVELSVVDDDGALHEGAPPTGWDEQAYALGLFRFRRRTV